MQSGNFHLSTCHSSSPSPCTIPPSHKTSIQSFLCNKNTDYRQGWAIGKICSAGKCKEAIAFQNGDHCRDYNFVFEQSFPLFFYLRRAIAKGFIVQLNFSFQSWLTSRFRHLWIQEGYRYLLFHHFLIISFVQSPVFPITKFSFVFFQLKFIPKWIMNNLHLMRR